MYLIMDYCFLTIAEYTRKNFFLPDCKFHFPVVYSNQLEEVQIIKKEVLLFMEDTPPGSLA